MSDQDRIDRLERRVASLEQLMRRVMAGDVEASTDIPEPPSAPPAPPPPPPMAAPEPPPVGRAAPPRPAPRPAIDGEQWVGQRGLLAVGVVALVLAAGYLLKLSFDRGWISPLLRCISGGVAGVVIATLGWSLHRRGYRSYGPALIGTGAAIIYSVLWAAAGWYGFIPPMTAVAGMAGISLLLAAIAWQIDVEWLGATAAVGAFTAPLVLGDVVIDADRLLLYLAAISATLGWVAWNKGWRLAMLVVALSYFGVGTIGAESAWEPLALAFGALGGAAGMWIGLRRNWWETRFLSFSGAWLCLSFANTPALAPLLVLGALVLAWPIWRYALRWDSTWPFSGAPQRETFLPSLYFYLTPFGLVWALQQLDLALIGGHGGAAAAIVALAYLAVGVTGDRRAFALVGTLGAIIAVLSEWERGFPSGGVLGVLALTWGIVARATRRSDWNGHAFVALLLGVLLHWALSVDGRPDVAPAFIDRWALVQWGLLAVTVALAQEFHAEFSERSALRSGLWTFAGVQLFIGVTRELMRYFQPQGIVPLGTTAAAELAAGLAVSAWWLAYAGVAVWYGFRTGIKPVRVAGLWVSGLAIIKVLLVDLGELDALYRVGSVFLLGVVSLLVAWAYHRKAREEEGTEGDRLQR
jgi:uncharacterized membrane protein